MMLEGNEKFGYSSHVTNLLIHSKYQEKYKHKQGNEQTKETKCKSSKAKTWKNLCPFFNITNNVRLVRSFCC